MISNNHDLCCILVGIRFLRNITHGKSDLFDVICEFKCHRHSLAFLRTRKKKQYGLSQFLFAALSFIPIRIHKNISTHCVTLNEQGVRLFVCVCMPECAIKSTLFYCLSLSSPLFQLFS